MNRKFRCTSAFPGFRPGEYYYSEDMFTDPEFTCIVDDQGRGNDFTEEELYRYFLQVSQEVPVPSTGLKRISWAAIITIVLIIITALIWRS